MKKIVAIVGSPRRRGNVSTLIDQMIKGAEESGSVSTCIFHLNELNIRGCQSCLYCREHEGCPIQDDMQMILSEIKDADVVVIGSPVYIHQVSGQTKIFLDRLYPLTDKQHKPRYGMKKLVTVYTQAAPFPFVFQWYFRMVNHSLKAMGLKYDRSLVMTKAFTPSAVSNDAKMLQRARQLGRSIAE